MFRITLCSFETIYIHNIFYIAFFCFSLILMALRVYNILLKYIFLKLSTKHFINLSKGGLYVFWLCNLVHPYAVSPSLQDGLSSRSMHLNKESVGIGAVNRKISAIIHKLADC